MASPVAAWRRSLSHAAALRRKAIKVGGAPPSIAAVADSVDEALEKGSSCLITQVGCTRRVFLLDPYLSAQELEGLAYRLKALTRNDAINSVLIATDGDVCRSSEEDPTRADAGDRLLPSSLIDLDHRYVLNESADPGFGPAPGQTYFVAGGYDPLRLYASGEVRDRERVDRLLRGLSDLALACRGDAAQTRVPVITVPHGAVEDGGATLLLSSYVLATSESTFAVRNPARGLSLDPVGLSYLLPRLGQEFQQPAAAYPGAGMILGLCGYEADADDMVETGLATHYLESIVTLGDLERTLAEIPPWNQQAVLKRPVRFYGYPEPALDHNQAYRNVAVADAVHCFARYRADGAEMWTTDDSSAYGDPSLETDPVPWHADRSSGLVDIAAAFDGIFRSEATLHGIQERLREVAARTAADAEEQVGIDVAADLVDRLERQAPLAAMVVHRLLTLGADKRETLRSCLEREHRVQARMLERSDFRDWATAAATKPHARFAQWQHKSFQDVSEDEVAELIES